jgi:hypothetical protein
MRVCVLLVSVGAIATPSFAQQMERVWVDVNAGVVSGGDSREDSASFLSPFGTAVLTAAYDSSAGPAFDVGGGYMFLPFLGAGVSFSATADTNPTTVSLSMTDFQVFFPNLHDSLVMDLQRSEGAAHLQVMARFGGDNLDVRVFGGPSWCWVKQDTVYNVFWGFVGAGPAVGIDIVDVRETVEEDSGLGYHVGGDVRYFFGRHVGIGGGVRFVRAEVKLPGSFHPYGGTPVTVTAGGLQTGGGLRLRF